MASCFPINKSRLAQDVIFEDSSGGGSMDDPKRILIVMDALKEFSIELLEWVLKNFTFRDCCTITLLGIMPWLNIPLSAKTWSDIWSMNLQDLASFGDKNQNDPKYQKVSRLIHLCQEYGVVPEIVTEMGHPIRLLVVEQISSLHATLVVFDRHHHKKYIEYYAEKIPCNMVVMNDNGDVDLIKKRTTFQTEVDNINRIYYSTAAGASPSASPMPRPHCSNAIISQNIKKYIKSKTRFMQQTSQ